MTQMASKVASEIIKQDETLCSRSKRPADGARAQDRQRVCLVKGKARRVHGRAHTRTHGDFPL